MKKTLLFLFTLLLSELAYPQIARWLIHPDYESVKVDLDSKTIVCDSAKHEVLWNLNGKRYSATPDHIHHFREGFAVTTKRDMDQIVGFYTETGKFTKISGAYVAMGYPYFSDGNLLVRDESGFFHYYSDDTGKLDGQQYDRANPFFNGYASCHTYEDLFKMRGPYWVMLTKDYAPVTFFISGKPVDADDIDFLSSVNDEQIAVVVVKNKLYYFINGVKNLQPVFAVKDEPNIKNQAKLDANIETSLQLRPDSIYTLSARCGKTDNITFRFNKFLVPLSVSAKGKLTEYEVKQVEHAVHPSPLRKEEKNKKYGINWENEEILPPQFEGYGVAFDNKAVVKLNGKYGIVAVEKDDQFRLKMNDGDNVGFKHKKFKTTVRLDIPTYIPAEKTRIEIDEDTGCDIDKTSIEIKNTEYGNFVQYNCVLSIPEDLTLDLSETVYPTQIYYEGLVSRIIPFKVNTWYNVYFDIRENEEPYIQNGILTSDFEIDDPKGEGTDTRWIPTIVCEERDSIPYQTDIIPINNFKFKYELHPLRDGLNTYYIQITEDGCPTVSFPREVSYSKPAAKQPAKKTKATIKTYNRTIKKPTPPKPKPKTIDVDI